MDLWSIGGRSICHGYMCILLYVRLMGCNGVAWIYCQLAGGSSVMGMCILLYMKLIGCHGFAWIYGQLAGVHLPWVHMNSVIYKTYWVSWFCMDLWSIGGRSICHGYMCILLYVRLMGYNGVAWIYGQLAGHPSAMGICAFCNI